MKGAMREAIREESCRAYASGLVEYARGAMPPPAELGRHLDSCGFCRERWEAETRVTAALRAIRLRVADRTPSPESRQRVTRAFEKHARQRSAVAARSRWQNNWVWGLAAAAMLLITAGVVAPLPSHFRPFARPVAAGTANATEPVNFYAASTDAGDLTNEDFVAVPYAPPLASGELVRIVHTDLDPQALATLGFDPDPAWTDDLPADVVVGEDGYPRAVKILDNSQR